MTKKLIIVINATPVLLTLGLYGMILARFFSNAIWVLWLQFGCFLMLGLYGLTMVVSLISARSRARFLIFGLGLGFFGLLGSFPATRFMLDRQGDRFMRHLPRYQEAIAWIEQHGGVKPGDDQFPDLAPDIWVQTNSLGGYAVFFRTYPGPFGARLRGYAYMSTDQWPDVFAQVYGRPKKLTNNWYRI
jgi:hypothetical protein